MYFEGYAAIYRHTDRLRDRLMPGACKACSTPLPLWYEHQPTHLLGIIARQEHRRDGWWVVGKIQPEGWRWIASCMQSGMLPSFPGLSIGYRPCPGTVAWHTEGRILSRVEIREVSVVREPAHDHARIIRFFSL
jgi:HK97 family phage prohead protease